MCFCAYVLLSRKKIYVLLCLCAYVKKKIYVLLCLCAYVLLSKKKTYVLLSKKNWSNKLFLLILQSQTALRKPGQGQRGRVGRHFEKRLLDALSWLSETWKISIIVKNETTVDALWVCIYFRQRARERLWLVYLHIFCVRLLRCPFYDDGQFQGLRQRNGQQVRLSHFSFSTPNRQRDEPEGTDYL